MNNLIDQPVECIRCRIKKLKKKRRYGYSILVGAGFILFWRGLWGLMDVYLFPNNQVLSYLASSLLGMTIFYIDDKSLRKLED